MKKLFLATAIAACTFNAQAQMGEAEQKAMMEYATPGKMHNLLASDKGEWKETITMWMEPGAKPTTYEATVTSEMIMGDRFQVSKHSGDMMGMPFSGLSTTGYDNAREVFVNTWIDNFSTGIMTSEGKMREDGKSIEFKGKCTDPMSKREISFRQVLTFVDEKNQHMDMYMTHEGKEFKSMAIDMRKTRGGAR